MPDISEVISVLPVLDFFVLSLLDRGLRTPYDLLKAGVSLGASTPSLRRLLAQHLITVSQKSAIGKRPRHEYQLTPAGKKTIVGARRTVLASRIPDDIDELLRVVDMAIHYRLRRNTLARFIRHAAANRLQVAEALAPRLCGGLETSQWTYAELRPSLDDARLRAEAKILVAIAERLTSRKSASAKFRRPSQRSK